MLSKSQINQYHENGYLIPDFRLSDNTLDDIKSAHAELIERHPEYVDYCPAILPHNPSFVRFACDDNLNRPICIRQELFKAINITKQ